ncbi:FecR family protein [Bradyrhizobium roseum]|uniref:FecR family protein n=1 Tax=Bradyrhizobium roseum TaxID=3056648 RepID=UPI0026099110|nr:FecR domain-containing protein [Bradyrhizobium roseus]WKA26111.1 FecR domain-containing protein [Bradyrhizobium roseus]
MTPSTEPGDTEGAGLSRVQREAYAWMAAFMANGLKPAEVRTMQAWYNQSPAHRAAYAEARRLWHSLGPVARQSMPDRDRQPGRPAILRDSTTTRRAVLAGTVAASAAYLVVRPPLHLWPSYAELAADLRTGAGEHREVILPSSVLLDLNTRTSIAVRARSANATELELISGEAAISTRGASTAVTVTANMRRISGDQADFNVRCEGPDVVVSCLAGNLTIAHDGTVKNLAAGQQLASGASDSTIASFDPERVTAWRRGLMIFDFTPVSQVVAEVNRYRSGRIILTNDDIGRRLLSARLRTDDTDKIITQLVHIFGAKVREWPGGIVVLS